MSNMIQAGLAIMLLDLYSRGAQLKYRLGHCGSPWSVHTNVRIASQLEPDHFLPQSFPIHYSPTVLPFDAIQSAILKEDSHECSKRDESTVKMNSQQNGYNLNSS